VGEKVPIGQNVGVTEPFVQYDPTGQGSHRDDAMPAKKPSGQSEHSVDLPEEKVPPLHTEVLLVEGELYPGGVSVQDEEPWNAYVPLEHAVLNPPLQAKPPSQVSHEVDPSDE
jgi:hypothetical protein